MALLPAPRHRLTAPRPRAGRSGSATRGRSPLGTACAIGFGILILPLRHFIHESQSIVDDLNDSSGAKLAVIAVGALVLAPLFEELLFRGLLLRSLQPLMSDGWAIGVQATVFGAVHFVGGSPLGTLIALPR